MTDIRTSESKWYASLALKVSVTAALMISVTIFFLSYSFIKEEVDHTETQLLSVGIFITDTLSRQAVTPVLNKDSKSLSNMIGVFSKRIPVPNLENLVTYVIIYDKSGTILAQSGDLTGVEKVEEIPSEARTPERHFIRKTRGGGIEISAPVLKGKLHLGLLRVGITEKYRAILLKEVVRNVTFTAVLLLILGIALSFVLSKRILNPLSNLAAFARRIGEGVWGETIEGGAHDEIGKLTEAFNEMSLKIAESIEKTNKAQEQLLQAEKFSALGKLSENLAHDLKNPVSSIRFLVEDAVDSHEENYFTEEDMRMILYEMERIDSIVNEMLSISGHQKLFLSKGNVNDLVRTMCEKIRFKLEAENIEFNLELEEDVPEFNFDGSKLEHALFNIIINAMQAIQNGGRITLRTTYDPRASSVVIMVHDTGEGISPERLKKIFDPYFTTKKKGTGLGLSMVYGIVKEHGGITEVESKEGEGTLFTLSFPV